MNLFHLFDSKWGKFARNLYDLKILTKMLEMNEFVNVYCLLNFMIMIYD